MPSRIHRAETDAEGFEHLQAGVRELIYRATVGWNWRNHPHQTVFKIADDSLPNRVGMGLDLEAHPHCDQLILRYKRGIPDYGEEAPIAVGVEPDAACARGLSLAPRRDGRYRLGSYWCSSIHDGSNLPKVVVTRALQGTSVLPFACSIKNIT